ncbi:MAG: aminopeptidase N [Alphaproteobacteria bacterium]|nr:MAG: aminopeptidase N [Alphaproteobacteria bacterium]
MLDISGDVAPPKPVRLAEYRPPDFVIDTVDLTFELRDAGTGVKSRLGIRRNPEAPDRKAPLHLDGEELELFSIALDGEPLGANRYQLTTEGGLILADVPAAFTLDVETRINPESNTALSGLYMSGGNFCTQCEPEGFRRITYFIDRPDVMARYTTTIVADKARFPVLLSNGNPVEQGETGDGRHWAKWVDPHPKPSYLFALVAGDLIAVRDRFTTRSGKEVALAIWVRRGDEDKCGHAMASLKKAMRWDEEVFGLEYDLDVFNIVAVSDFNMGAMENKGLNIFNTRYVLAKPETATDTDYQNIEAVIAHEYFHNWTGNRVTCRDWFQLSLKEGLTVFRDQEFSADQGSRAVRRIAEVRTLRAIQFPEDDGPLAHPVRPDSYIRIDNFYTPTVYNKGAELVRMIHTLIGKEGFRRGMDLYSRRHDNHAATIEDFVAAMQDASGVDLGQFKRWYEQAGTPEITIEDRWDAAARSYELTAQQKVPPTPGQPEKLPMLIPLAMGLIGPEGSELPTRLEDEPARRVGTRVLPLADFRQSFRFVDVPAPPVPSLLRGFSAPVKLKDVPLDRLKFLAVHDTEPFARWEAGQQVATKILLDRIGAHQRGEAPAPLDPDLIAAMRRILADAERDPAFAAEALSLPSEAFLADQLSVVDVDAIHAAREGARAALGEALAAEFAAAYRELADAGPYSIDGTSIGRRALRNACLGYLAAADPEKGAALAMAQLKAAQNMTDVLAALTVLVDLDRPERAAALARFYELWSQDGLVIDKWFALQARSSLPQTPDRVRELTHHSAFERKNPNRVRALIGTFAQANQLRFHDASGAGYRLLADEVIALDPLNPTTAARLVQSLGSWRRHDAARQALMRRELERILATSNLSKNTYEMVSKSLA